jgi:two-component system, cell cycle response regulator DivK
MMSRSVYSDELAIIRDEARMLVQRAGDHEERLEALVKAAETYVRRAEEALSDALDVTHRSVADFQALLSMQLQSSQDDAETARQLCAGAHQQRLAADHLFTHLDRAFSAEPRTEQRSRGNAVLVVDDYGEIRDVIAEVLRNAGFVVRTAANGLEALLVAYEMRPAVIVMDMAMPVLDGIEATRLIKSTEATRPARVIAYTGDPSLDDSLVQTLFAAVVKKPATPAALLATVQHLASL